VSLGARQTLDAGRALPVNGVAARCFAGDESSEFSPANAGHPSASANSGPLLGRPGFDDRGDSREAGEWF
jgi:hypothetical protein